MMRHPHPTTLRGRFASLLVVILLLLAMTPAIGHAEEGEGEGGGEGALKPPTDVISSGAWTIITGMDPRAATAISREGDTSVALANSGMASSGGFTGGSVAQQVPFRSPSPAFSRNVLVTQQVGLYGISTEPHIAVDPTDPLHIVLGVIDYNLPSMATYVTFDGGETWDGPNQIRYLRRDSGTSDPVVAFDRDGVVYLASMSIGYAEFRLGNIGSYAEASSIVVSRSYDGGLTWTDAVSAVRSTVDAVSNVDDEGKERGTVTMGFIDKEWITTGPNPANPELDSIYVSYTDFETTYTLEYADEVPFFAAPYTQSTIRMVRSDDGGTTWTEPFDISPTVLSGAVEGGEESEGGLASAPRSAASRLRSAVAGGSPLTPEEVAEAEGFRQESPDAQEEGGESGALESDRTVQGSQPAVLSDGTVVIAYFDSTNDGFAQGLTTVRVVLSRDGGETRTAPIIAGVMREVPYRPRNANLRMSGSNFPQIAIGPDDSIYLALTSSPADKATDDGDVYLLRSLDKGATWEEPMRVNQDDTDRLQFFPAVDVSPDGTVHVMWGDMRDDPEEVRYHIYYTQSEDQGETFGFSIPEQNYTAPDTVVTDFASNSLRGFINGLFLGDYFAIAATDEDVYLVWPDTRLGEYGGPNQQIAFARKTALPQPELFLSPPNGAAGRTVTVQGFGFQAESSVFLDIGGITVSNLLTNELGEFTTTISMPVSGEGAVEFRAFDETGNRAIASFYVDFGFDTLQETLAAIEADAGSDASGTPAPSGAMVDAATPAEAAASYLRWFAAAAGIVAAGVGGYVIAARRARIRQ